MYETQAMAEKHLHTKWGFSVEILMLMFYPITPYEC